MSASPGKGKKPAAKKSAKPAEHPPYIDMIIAAVRALKERSGSSRQAIYKYIAANYKVGDSLGAHLKLALKRGVASGKLLQPKGTGAAGSFKVASAAKMEKKKAPPKRKPAAKAKKAAPKKPAAKKPKKPAVKKATKSPKKPVAKKAAKKTAKKPAAKKPAAKKPVAKKPVKKTGAKKAGAKKSVKK